MSLCLAFLEAGLQNLSWQEAGFSPFRVAVNAPGSQLVKPNLHQIVDGGLENLMKPKGSEVKREGVLQYGGNTQAFRSRCSLSNLARVEPPYGSFNQT
jgi:hypothetical protein